MRSAVVLISSFGLLLGCTTNRDARYYSTYRIDGVQTELSSGQAEQVHMALANSTVQQTSSRYDRPVQLLNSPQPVMSPADTDAKVTGGVVVQLVFSEIGEVESVTIVESSKESLSEAVQQAVKRWRIAPATSAGRAVKLVVRQAFTFKTE